MGSGTDSSVLALGRYGDDIYCGGNFRHADGIEANHIVKWSIVTKQWQPVMDGTINGVDGGVSAFAPHDKGLIVGGGFSHAGSILAHKVAYIHNGTWVEMNGGMKGINSYVSCIRPAGCGHWNNDGSYWIGGVFDSSGNVEVGNVAHWNHADGRWENGARVNDPVYTINDVCCFVFVGGKFTKIGNDDVNNIGALDSHVDLAGGVDNTVFAMTGYWPPVLFTSTDNPLYVGGVFQNAGGKPSQNFGIYNFGIYYGPSTSVRSDKPNIKSLHIYPSQATTSLTVQLPDYVSSLIVTDAAGRRVKQLYPNSGESLNLDVTCLPNGMYNAIAKTKDRISVAAFVIAR